MPETYNAAKQGPRELPDGHPDKGGAVYFKSQFAPMSQKRSTPPAETPSEAPPDPMAPAVEAHSKAMLELAMMNPRPKG